MITINFILDTVCRNLIIDLPEIPLLGECYYFNINGLFYEAKVYDIDKYIEVKKDKADFSYLVYCHARAIHEAALLI